ncbi:MAG: chemotaxis protein CheC [Clostridiales bacterium]|nr:chemotaxis protein CheC [Clostridiales bacterium]
MGFNLEDLNEVHFDVLREIGNIGAGNAATSLSVMLDKPIDMDVPKLNIVDFNNAGAILGAEDKKTTGIYLEFYGDISGTIMLLLDIESTYSLLSLLMDTDTSNRKDEEPNEMEKSALKEIGNILTGSFLTALSSLLQLSIMHTIPAISIDMVGAILSVPFIIFGQEGDKALFIETSFLQGEQSVSGHLFLIPNSDSYKMLLETLGEI